MDAGRKKFFIVIGGVVLLAIAVLIVLNARGQSRVVREMTVGNTAFTIALPESGVVQYPQLQTMSSQVAGNIGRIFAKTGDRVVAGQLLATIVNPAVVAEAQSSQAAYRAASAKAQSATAAGTSNLVQAQENVETARARLAKAQQDSAAGVEAGAGYGGLTAADARAQANANYVTAQTNLREAQRLYFAYRDLYANKAVSRDQLDQAEAKYEQATADFAQARLAKSSVSNQLTRSRAVIQDNLRSAQQGYAQAQAALAAAEVDANGGEVAAASAQAAQAGAESSLAQEQANSMEIRAPYDGIVLSVATQRNDPLRPLQPGDAIGVGQPIVTLAARRAFVVRTRVDEQDVINVHLGERAQITGEDFPGHLLTGHVVEISPIAQRPDAAATSSPRTIATTIAIDQPPEFLRDGMSVDINIFTTDLQRAVVVPNEAILHGTGGSYVYVVRNGAAYRQPVVVGLSNESGSVIVSGLRSGDVIVAQNVPGLSDGSAVRT